MQSENLGNKKDSAMDPLVYLSMSKTPFQQMDRVFFDYWEGWK